MPLHDVGYRAWTGRRSLVAYRWWVIASTGIQLVWRGTWLRRTFFLAWLPAIMMAVAIFLYEQSIEHEEARRNVGGMLGRLVRIPEITQAFRNSPGEARHEVWSALLMTFFRSPQAIVVVLIVGIIAPRLISYDLRSKGFLLYFSRPISTTQYILGKSLVVWFYLALVSTLPALVLYVLGVLFSPQLGVIWQTWDLPLRVLAASIVLIIPTASVALALSACTTESRYAAFGWFAIWIVGWVSYATLTESATRDLRRVRGRGAIDFETVNSDLMAIQEKWRFVSPYHVLGKIQQWVFGLQFDDSPLVPYIVAVVTITCVALLVVYLRVASQLRA